MRREGPFEELRNPTKLAIFNERILQLFAELPYLAVTVQIDKRLHLERYGVWHFDPYHYCLRCLVERFVNYLERWNWRGDVVIEARYKKSDKKLKASFQRIYESGTENIPATVVQRRLLSHDIGIFPKNANVAGLQIADLIAHPSARHMRHEKDSTPQPQDFGTAIAEILLHRRYARDPRSRKIHGWGRKWLP